MHVKNYIQSCAAHIDRSADRFDTAASRQLPIFAARAYLASDDAFVATVDVAATDFQ